MFRCGSKAPRAVRQLPESSGTGCRVPTLCQQYAIKPEQVLRYLSRYIHRMAISNRRLIAANEKSVSFKYKDYRIEGPGRYTTITLDAHEFIRRFLMHVLPKGFIASSGHSRHSIS